ncbi:MAG: anti-sigma F factor [Bacillota bacterium]|jgi:stage II sporulation protein AB (anti-sigma F factor)|nr:anti-sigma F factor [Bacillota bacterium]MDI9415833.1 anti-sigma F factor [Bacillota bacterium]NLD12410.1 anti-sigma F factor [Bacillota bacterium]HAV21428.1 anti-sigma F factor [Bacillota bacterium]HOB88039.1 anti-sigma F factor [Bacillota bacterium]
MVTENYMTIEFPAIPENVEFARTVVACFASQISSFTLEEIDDIKLVVSEAVSNTVLHSYDTPGGIIRLTAARNGDTLYVTVEDFGKGITEIEKAKEPAFTTDPDRMGMGFTIMEALSDELHVTSVPGKGVKVEIRKSPHGTAKASEELQC